MLVAVAHSRIDRYRGSRACATRRCEADVNGDIDRRPRSPRVTTTVSRFTATCVRCQRRCMLWTDSIAVAIIHFPSVDIVIAPPPSLANVGCMSHNARRRF
jgi:hypothetical protein